MGSLEWDLVKRGVPVEGEVRGGEKRGDRKLWKENWG